MHHKVLIQATAEVLHLKWRVNVTWLTCHSSGSRSGPEPTAVALGSTFGFTFRLPSLALEGLADALDSLEVSCRFCRGPCSVGSTESAGRLVPTADREHPLAAVHSDLAGC